MNTRERCGVRGFTLAEVMVTVSVTSALMLMAIGVVHRTMRMDSDFRHHANAGRALHQLGTEFRRDVNRAHHVEFDENSDELVLTLSYTDHWTASGNEQEVRYVCNDSQVLREESRGDDRRREQFSLARGAGVTLEEQESPHRMVLTVLRPVQIATDAPPVELHVEAVVGRRAAMIRHSGAQP